MPTLAEVIDSLGPFSVKELQSIAGGIAPDCYVESLDRVSPEEMAAHLLRGRPAVVLWKHEPLYGHYILLKPRLRGDVEIFDPQADGTRGWEAVEEYLTLEHLNGGSTLDEVLKTLEAHGRHFSQATRGPQNQSAESCGLWCLLRAATPKKQPPSEFWRRAQRKL